MKRTIAMAMCMMSLMGLHAQVDSTFVGRFVNTEYNIFLNLNLVEKNVEVAGQEVLGTVDGYIGCEKTTTVWVIVDSSIDGNKATLEVINNYGSEDFTATLTKESDGTYTLKHQGGSTLKFPVEKKWHKIPAKVAFKRKETEDGHS